MTNLGEHQWMEVVGNHGTRLWGYALNSLGVNLVMNMNTLFDMKVSKHTVKVFVYEEIHDNIG